MQKANVLLLISLFLLISPCFAHAPVIPLPRAGSDSFDCGFCEFLITLIYGFIAENATEQQIITVVDGICTYVPETLSQMCKSFIDEYGPTIIYLLFQKETPSYVCTVLNICNTTATDLFGENYNLTIAEKSYPNCKWCNWIRVTFLNRLANDKKISDKFINKILNTACAKRSGVAKKKCESLLTQYGNELLSNIRKQDPSNPACVTQSLCSAS